jgi:hypothetical protein
MAPRLYILAILSSLSNLPILGITKSELVVATDRIVQREVNRLGMADIGGRALIVLMPP